MNTRKELKEARLLFNPETRHILLLFSNGTPDAEVITIRENNAIYNELLKLITHEPTK